ncbi:hypothetical protein BpHYR1_021872 [Brachionus plicatilis]|uniref:Uncharacterized protein n=1 Tax=Brachionus plicatilis TaxID=10195 RepID=A0A3M7T4D6_BRAPC|nr:hypothetical protein BpHYR1_021872 [Brachionus plicatilis]
MIQGENKEKKMDINNIHKLVVILLAKRFVMVTSYSVGKKLKHDPSFQFPFEPSSGIILIIYIDSKLFDHQHKNCCIIWPKLCNSFIINPMRVSLNK